MNLVSPGRSLLVLALLLGTLLLATQPATAATSKPWRSIRPEAPARLLHIKNVDAAATPEKESRTWARIAVGDTLVFRYRGEGEFRLDARPAMEPYEKDAVIRYSIRFGNNEARHFKRNSEMAGNYGIEYTDQSSIMARARLGVADRKSVVLDPSQQTVLVYLRDGGASEVYVRGLVRGDVERLNTVYRDGTNASGGRWSIDAALGGAGYVGNAYMAPKTGTVAEEGAAYWPADVGVRYRNRNDLPFRFTADYDFSGRFYSDPILDERRHSAQLEERWDFGRWGGVRSAKLTLSQEFKTKDDTFFGRGAADEFQTSGSIGSISFANRFDYLNWGGQAELDLRTSDTFEFVAQAIAHRRDYDLDFANEDSIYSLDQNRFEFGVGFGWEFSPDATLSLDAAMQLRNYDEKFSRNINGSQVLGEATRLRRWPVELHIDYSPKVGLQAGARLGILATQDQFEGYWDRTSTIYGAELGWRFSRRTQIGAWFRGSSTSYDNATVGYTPTGVLRDKSSARFGLEGEYGLYPNADLVLSYTYQDLDNNSPTFAYTQSEFVGGVVIKY